MNVNRMLLLLTALTMIGCGGAAQQASEGNPVVIPGLNSQEFTARLTQHVNLDNGATTDEITALNPSTATSVKYRYTGVVWCLPDIAFRTPLVDPVPPSTVLGCANEGAITYNNITSGDTITFDILLPQLTVEVSGTASYTKLLSNHPFKAQLHDNNVVASATVMLIPNQDGSYHLGAEFAPLVTVSWREPVVTTDISNVVADSIWDQVAVDATELARLMVEARLQQRIFEFAMNDNAPDLRF